MKRHLPRPRNEQDPRFHDSSGRVEDFSLDMLLALAARAGLHSQVRLGGTA